MDINIDKLIELLNKDLEMEYAAAIQYINHAAVMTGKAQRDIVRELENHANDNIRHAMILSDQISCLGGLPSVNVGEIRASKDNKEMLLLDLHSHEDAIYRYKERIEQAESLQLFLLAQQLQDILVKEESHTLAQQLALEK